MPAYVSVKYRYLYKAICTNKYKYLHTYIIMDHTTLQLANVNLAATRSESHLCMNPYDSQVAKANKTK